MISIEECKKIIDGESYTDEEIRSLCDALYIFTEQLLDDYFDKVDNDNCHE